MFSIESNLDFFFLHHEIKTQKNHYREIKNGQIHYNHIFFLTISNAFWSSDFSSWSSDDLDDYCTRSNPCYFENGDFHHVGSISNDPWNSYTITNLAVTVGVAILIPVVHNGINRFLDYAAYKWEFWRGLKDSGGVAQTEQLRAIAGSFRNVDDNIRIIKDILDYRTLDKNEQREALSVPLRLVSDAIAGGNENSFQTNGLLAQVLEELKKNGENSEKAVQQLIKLQENITQNQLQSLQSMAEENNKTATLIQEKQEKTDKNFTEVLVCRDDSVSGLRYRGKKIVPEEHQPFLTQNAIAVQEVPVEQKKEKIDEDEVFSSLGQHGKTLRIENSMLVIRDRYITKQQGP